jgi:hypothetical protein
VPTLKLDTGAVELAQNELREPRAVPASAR